MQHQGLSYRKATAGKAWAGKAGLLASFLVLVLLSPAALGWGAPANETIDVSHLAALPLPSLQVAATGIDAVVNQPPPSPQGPGKYVTDMAGMLTPEDTARLRQALLALDASGRGQVALLTLPTTDRELADLAPEIFNAWGLGSRDKDNGVLILVNAARVRQGLSGNRIFIATGQGVEAILPDAVAGRILDEHAVRAFAQGEYSSGLRQTTEAVIRVLGGDPAARRHYKRPKSDRLPFPVLLFLMMVVLSMMLRGRYGGGFYLGGGGGFGGGSGGFGGGGFGGGGSSGGGAGR